MKGKRKKKKNNQGMYILIYFEVVESLILSAIHAYFIQHGDCMVSIDYEKTESGTSFVHYTFIPLSCAQRMKFK